MASNRSGRAQTRVSSTTTGARVVRDIVQRRPGSYQRDRKRAAVPFDEIGTSGLRQWSGWVRDEWLSELQGREAAWRYREFLDNDPIAGGFFFLIETLAKGVTWSVTDGDSEWQEHVHSCMDDMSRTWGDFLGEALTFLPYGYAPCEEVFKRREGHQPESFAMLGEGAPEDDEDSRSPASSKYDDGKIGWRKLPLRAQETTLHWDFDGYSKLRGLVQLDWHGGENFIPITKLALFRFRPVRNNPEGYSLLRKAWTSFYRLRNLQDIEAIGAARDLAGIPEVVPPDGVDLFAPGNEELYARVKEMVTTVHRDEDEGIVWPSAGWIFRLVSSGGSRQFDINAIIRRYEQRIAASLLADFMLLGQDGLGSYAMVDVKSELFGMAVNAVLDSICEVFNRFSIPRLLALNGVHGANLPKLTHTTASRIDIEKVGTFLYNLAGAGANIDWDGNPEVLKQLFQSVGLGINVTTVKPEEQPEQPPALPKPDPMEKADGDDLDAIFGQSDGSYGDMWVNHPERRMALSFGDWEGDIAHDAHRVAERLLPGYKIDSEAEQGAPEGDNWTQVYAKGKRVANLNKAEGEEETEEERQEREAAEKASLVTGVAATLATPAGTALLVGPLLGARAAVLATQLEREILSALGLMGGALATAYMAFAAKNPEAWLERKQLANRVLQAFDLRQWVSKHLEPLMRNQASRVASDTANVLGKATGERVNIDNALWQRLAREGMSELRKTDLEPQIRRALNKVLEDAFAAGENPEEAARRIRELVPAGRFVNAGSKYRAQLIAKDVTARMQRAVARAAYEDMSHVVAMRLRDGVYGPPRSDAFCIERDGKIVGFDEVPEPAHIQCTLGYEPVVRS